MHSVTVRLMLFLWSGLISTLVMAQKPVPALDREVTVTASDETTASVLSQIASQTGIKFSYSPTRIPSDRRVTFSVTRKPLRTVLNIMFGESVEIKQKGNFVILTPKPQPAAQAVIKEITISGYVYDDRGEKLAYASILNKKEQTAAVSNQYGYYKIKVTADELPINLKVVKETYTDTLYQVSGKQTNVDFVLMQIREEEPVVFFETDSSLFSEEPGDTLPALTLQTPPADTMLSEHFRSLRNMLDGLLSEEDKANIRNLKDTLFAAVQLSVIPQVSTNKLLVGNTVNAVSLSLLLGYSKGISVAGFSGIANIVAGNAAYAQAAGMLNVVQDSVTGGLAAGMINMVDKSVTGGQAAGIMNITGGSVNGGQAAGLMNITTGKVTGAEAAGWMNITRGELVGVQMAGLGNLVKGDCNGVQIAGMFNLVKGKMNGAQIAGMANVADGEKIHLQVSGVCNISKSKVQGLQLSGVGNVAENQVSGVQVAAVFNVAKDTVAGAQVGLVNLAGHSSGLQIGLVNFSETNSGASLGLFSYTREGYQKIELYGDDAMYTQLAFRTGVQKLHNIFTAGVDLTNRLSGLWSFGYGFGSYFSLSEHWKFGGDLISQVYLKGGQIDKAPQLNTLFIAVERNIGRKFSIGIGPSYHLMVNYANDTEVADFISPYSFYDKTYSGGTNLRMWVGGKLSLKFL